MRIRSFISLFLLFASVLFSKEANSPYMFDFLGIGGKEIGFGRAYGSLTRDVFSIYWNPAGLSYVKGFDMGFSYSRFSLDRSFYFAGFAFPFYTISGKVEKDKKSGEVRVLPNVNLVLGIGILSLYKDSIAGYDETGSSSFKFLYQGNIGYLSLAFKRNLFNIGINIKGLYQRIGEHKYYGMSTDFGIQTVIFVGIKASLMIVDALGGIVKEGESYDKAVPIYPKISPGISFVVPPGFLSLGISLVTDVKSSYSYFNVGLEFELFKGVTVRGGLSDQAFSTGFTVKPFRSIRISYGFLIEKNLGDENNHSLSLYFDF